VRVSAKANIYAFLLQIIKGFLFLEWWVTIPTTAEFLLKVPLFSVNRKIFLKIFFV
jgi:hypothetical protein